MPLLSCPLLELPQHPPPQNPAQLLDSQPSERPLGRPHASFQTLETRGLWSGSRSCGGGMATNRKPRPNDTDSKAPFISNVYDMVT